MRAMSLSYAFLLLGLWSAGARADLKNNLGEKLVIPHERYTLSNGLTVILSEDKSAPLIAMNIWYRVGAVNERRGRGGLAHLFEHLMFEGSRHAKNGAHFRWLEDAGAFDINASTGFYRTNYYQTLPSAKLELALALESSRMAFLNIDQQKLDEQRAVVRREREQRIENTPYGHATLKLWQSIFPEGHPYHGRVIGSHEELESASLEDVKDFYDRHYGPSNACLTLVGDLKADAKGLIAKYFATLPKTPAAKAIKPPSIAIDAQEVMEVEEKLGKLMLVRMQYLTPALFFTGDAELDVIAHILTGGENGRLSKAITRDERLAVSTFAYQQGMEHQSVFTIDAVLNQGIDPFAAVKAIDGVIANLTAEPPAPLEIERARNKLLTERFFALQAMGGSSGRAEQLQSYNQIAETPDFIKDDIKRYQGLDASSVVKAVKAHLPMGRSRKILIARPAPAAAKKEIRS